MKKRILLIEDEKTLRFLLSQNLAEEGYDVREAIDGEEGLQKLKEGKVDLVLLDLLLPGVHGFEVLSRIKRDPELSSIPVIIISNLGQKEEIDKGLKLGADDYLIKASLSISEIIAKIREVLK